MLWCLPVELGAEAPLAADRAEVDGALCRAQELIEWAITTLPDDPEPTWSGAAERRYTEAITELRYHCASVQQAVAAQREWTGRLP